MTGGNAAPLVKWYVGSIVYSVAVSQDASRAVSGSHDGHVRVWDVRTGALVLGPLEGHTGPVQSVAFSPDNTRIVSGSSDYTIRIWDAQTGNPIGGPLKGHTRIVCSVAFSHDGTHIVSASGDHTIRVWDARTGSPVGKPLEGHSDWVNSAVFSHDSTRIVSGSFDHTIRIWDALIGTQIGEPLKGHTNWVYSVAFSQDSTRIFSCSSDFTVRIWNAHTGAPIGKPLRGHAGTVFSVAFSRDSTRIVSSSFDNSIRLWDARIGTPIGELLKAHTNWIYSVVFSPDGSCIVSGSRDGTIGVWQVAQSSLGLDMLASDGSPSFDMVTSKMSTQEIFDCLLKHGCADLSSAMDPARFSSSAIAFGGFGDVWQAWLKTGILVAIKCLRVHLILEGDEKGMKRMARELYHWSKARHENIQELLGIITFQDRLGMVSLWMDNGNLQQYIEKNPGVDRYGLCIQLAKGVAYLHGIGMVHGDIKAPNVLVSADGILKISDFDYSILSESTLRFSETTKSGGGTVRWMAPELLLHPDGGDNEDGDEGGGENEPQAPRTTKTDVYALGMTMLEILSGKVPYHQLKHEVGVIRALDRKEPPRRPQVLSVHDERATRMWTLLLTCWDHDPSARPDASAVLETLQSFVRSGA